MSRKDEIAKAAMRYEKMLRSNPECMGDLVFDAFFEGAQWADKCPMRIWYEADEKPKDGFHILIQYTYQGDTEYKSYHINRINWDAFVDYNDVEKWMYIDDLK